MQASACRSLSVGDTQKRGVDYQAISDIGCPMIKDVL